jgi:hypothetical protein
MIEASISTLPFLCETWRSCSGLCPPWVSGLQCCRGNRRAARSGSAISTSTARDSRFPCFFSRAANDGHRQAHRANKLATDAHGHLTCTLGCASVHECTLSPSTLVKMTDDRQGKDYRENFAFGTEFLVFVEGRYPEDGGLRVLLEQYVGTPVHAEPLCRSEEDVRRALVELGAREEQAASTASLIWASHVGDAQSDPAG